MRTNTTFSCNNGLRDGLTRLKLLLCENHISSQVTHEDVVEVRGPATVLVIYTNPVCRVTRIGIGKGEVDSGRGPDLRLCWVEDYALRWGCC